jgi:hypothetical protein
VPVNNLALFGASGHLDAVAISLTRSRCGDRRGRGGALSLAASANTTTNFLTLSLCLQGTRSDATFQPFAAATHAGARRLSSFSAAARETALLMSHVAAVKAPAQTTRRRLGPVCAGHRALVLHTVNAVAHPAQRSSSRVDGVCDALVKRLVAAGL